MADTSALPEHVKSFIKSTTHYLSLFELELRLSEAPHPNGHIYEVDAPDGPVTIILHRTQRSDGLPVGEYRLRVHAKLDENFSEFAKDKGDLLNRVATLGALIPEEGFVICQALIPEVASDTTAGLLALAIAHARRSLVVANAKVFSGKDEAPVEQMSAWTDLDFEGLHYDQAHLGIGEMGRRRWSMKFLGPQGLSGLELVAVHNNPYWGGGLLSLLRVPKAAVAQANKRATSDDLNKWGNLIGDAPTFGAWVDDGGDFVFVQFMPNFVKELSGVLELLVSHATVRSREAVMLAYTAREPSGRNVS